MDKIYQKMLEGSTYIYRTEPWVKEKPNYELGDYLLSDLKTVVKQSELAESKKADVIGICIGKNPLNNKSVFWNINCFSQNSDDGTFVREGHWFLNSESDSTHWYKYDTATLLLKDGTRYPWRKFIKTHTIPAQSDIKGICVGKRSQGIDNARLILFPGVTDENEYVPQSEEADKIFSALTNSAPFTEMCRDNAWLSNIGVPADKAYRLVDISGDDDDSNCKIEDGILDIYFKEENNGKNPWDNNQDVNVDVIPNMPGYITSTHDYNNWDSDEYCCINDFAGKQNTIEWYKQMTAAGYNVATDMPALKVLMDINGVESLGDNFDGWFLGSTGYMNMIASFWGNYSEEKGAEAQELRNKFNASLKNLNLERFADVDDPLDNLNYSDFWGSTFCYQFSGCSGVHYLCFDLGSGDVGYNFVNNGGSLFALIER